MSSAGEEQARLLGVRRQDDPLAAVFCSDLSRSFRTGEIAFGERSLSIIRDARLRECDYGDLTRQPSPEIELRRPEHVVQPFPNGESYEQVEARVLWWLSDLFPQFDGRTVLVIGHRATFYALEHLLNGVTLREAVTSAWKWQPGWTYHLAQSPKPKA